MYISVNFINVDLVCSGFITDIIFVLHIARLFCVMLRQNPDLEFRN